MATKSIIYVSPVRYPTEKAYGVTIKYTMAALELFGYECKVVDFQALTASRFSQCFRNQYMKKLNRLIDHLGFGRLLFNLKRLLVALVARQQFSRESQILWTRDPLIALTLNLTRKPSSTVIEVHQVPHFLDKILMRSASARQSVILAPISIDLQNRLLQSRFNFSAQSIILCPMGVPEEFFKARTIRSSVDIQNIRMTYVGGLTSNGIDQGVKEIIGCIQNLNNQSNTYHIGLHLYGLSQAEEIEIRHVFPNEFENQSILCEKRQAHETLIPKLQDTDIFLLPYPDGDFFKARFPLKALEYAALARPIMVSDTPSHRNIFLDEEVWFFQDHSCESFKLALRMLLENEEIASRKIELAFTKAKNYTYAQRVAEIVNRFSI